MPLHVLSCGAVGVVQLLYTATTTLRASANNNKQQCCWLSMSIGGSGGTAVKSAALVAAPFGLAVVACCGPRLLPRQLLCCVAWRYGTRYYMPWRVYVRILGWSCVLRSFSFSQVCGFILFVSNHLFCCSALPRCPCLIPHDGFAISFFE